MTFNQSAAHTSAALHPAAHMGPVALTISDLAQSVDFYTGVLGMSVLDRTPGEATLGAGSTHLIYLHERPGARPQPDRSTGLYHVAILTPSRPDLGRVLINLARTQYPVQGFSDHAVSEAIYLADPDGNGLEIYRDRPRDEWPMNGSQIAMVSEPLDLNAIVETVEDPQAPFAGLPDGTTVGHVHLRVGNIATAQAFYSDVIGFDVVARMGPSALFVSAGGYHHHLGMNTWQSAGASRPPEGSVGLRYHTLIVPDEAAQEQVADRLRQASIAHEKRDGALVVDDPWGTQLRILTEQV